MAGVRCIHSNSAQRRDAGTESAGKIAGWVGLRSLPSLRARSPDAGVVGGVNEGLHRVVESLARLSLDHARGAQDVCRVTGGAGSVLSGEIRRTTCVFSAGSTGAQGSHDLLVDPV